MTNNNNNENKPFKASESDWLCVRHWKFLLGLWLFLWWYNTVTN